MNLQTTQPLLLAALVGWGAVPGTPCGSGGPGKRLVPQCCKQENGLMKIAQGRKLHLSWLRAPLTHPSPTTSDCGCTVPWGSRCPLAQAETPTHGWVCPRVLMFGTGWALTIAQHHIPQLLQGIGEAGNICQQLGDVLGVDEGTIPALHGAVGCGGLVALGHGTGDCGQGEAGGAGMAAQAGGALQGAHGAGAAAELGTAWGQLPHAGARSLQAILAGEVLGSKGECEGTASMVGTPERKTPQDSPHHHPGEEVVAPLPCCQTLQLCRASVSPGRDHRLGRVGRVWEFARLPPPIPASSSGSVFVMRGTH